MSAPRITARTLEILRLLHGGVRLRVASHARDTAILDMLHIAPRVQAGTVAQLVADGLLTLDTETSRYQITDAGRDQVRVRDHVDDFLRAT